MKLQPDRAEGVNVIHAYTAQSVSVKYVASEEAATRYWELLRAPGNREAEGQMVAFSKAPHDDLVDAVGAGVRYFLSRSKKKGPGVGSASIPYA